jgi:hypothetical protein
MEEDDDDEEEGGGAFSRMGIVFYVCLVRICGGAQTRGG